MNRPKLHIEKGMDLGEYALKLTTYVAPDAAQKEAHERIAVYATDLITCILDNAPPCADTTHAIRLVREARMWANSAIALRGFV